MVSYYIGHHQQIIISSLHFLFDVNLTDSYETFFKQIFKEFVLQFSNILNNNSM